MLIFNREYRSAIVVSIILHLGILIVMLGSSWFSQVEKTPHHKMVEVVVIDPKAIEQQAKGIREKRDVAKKAEQQRVEKLRQQAEELEKKRKKEEQRQRKLKEQKVEAAKAVRNAERQKQLEQEQKKIEAHKAHIAAEKAAKAELIRKEKAVAAAKIAAAKKTKAEAAEQARLAREKKAQDIALNDIFSDLEAETQQISVARQKYISSELERYGVIYTQMIQEKLLIEESFKGQSCQINIRLVQTGKGAIVSKVSSINGEEKLCAAAKRAVAQVGTFPLPAEKDVVEQLKNINLTVEPK